MTASHGHVPAPGLRVLLAVRLTMRLLELKSVVNQEPPDGTWARASDRAQCARCGNTHGTVGGGSLCRVALDPQCCQTQTARVIGRSQSKMANGRYPIRAGA